MGIALTKTIKYSFWVALLLSNLLNLVGIVLVNVGLGCELVVAAQN